MQLMAACTARCRRPRIAPFQVYQPQLVVSRLHSCYRSTDAITGRPTRMDIHHGPDDAHRCCYILSSRCVCSQHDIYSRWQLRVPAIDPARITGRARDRSMLWMPMTTRPASASTSHWMHRPIECLTRTGQTIWLQRRTERPWQRTYGRTSSLESERHLSLVFPAQSTSMQSSAFREPRAHPDIQTCVQRLGFSVDSSIAGPGGRATATTGQPRIEYILPLQ